MWWNQASTKGRFSGKEDEEPGDLHTYFSRSLQAVKLFTRGRCFLAFRIDSSGIEFFFLLLQSFMQMLEGFLLWQDWEGKQLAC